MPYIGRHERLADYPTPGIRWIQHKIKTSDKEIISVCQSEYIAGRAGAAKSDSTALLYLQGNASSTPPRLPHLSRVLMGLNDTTKVTIWAVSYRGYWDSTGSPSESGCLNDIDSALQHIISTTAPCKIVLWGHSIGAGLAVLSLPRVAASHKGSLSLILETPFLSTMTLLKHIYPQKWLPYRYLSPFLRTRLDMVQSLDCLLDIKTRPPIKVFIVQGEHDEIVPRLESDAVYDLFKSHSSFATTREIIRGGLHMDCIGKPQLRSSIAQFLEKI